jgi:hypothetical protein
MNAPMIEKKAAAKSIHVIGDIFGLKNLVCCESIMFMVLAKDMANVRRKKEGLRAALFAFFAGAHHIIQEVEKSQALTPGGGGPEAIEARHAMLDADYERLREAASQQSIEMLVEMLDEEGLYPFGSEWPREALQELVSKLIPPSLELENEAEGDLRFRFKKGFKEMLGGLAEGLESVRVERSTLDHWMVLLLNMSFHAGMVVAARNAEDSKVYYTVLTEIEEDTEPWSRYPQIAAMLDRELRVETRRRTGLVSDLDY